MNSRHAIAVASAALILALGGAIPASASTGGACLLDFPVSFDSGGRILQTGPGVARCAGRIADTGVEPSIAPATVGGIARRGLTGCAPILSGGTVAMTLLRLISFDPNRRFRFAATWTALDSVGIGLVRGSGSARGQRQSFGGDVRFVPASAGCAATRFAPGRLQMELLFP